MRFNRPLAALILLVGLPFSLAADVITFESFSDGTVLSNQIPGLAFSNAITLTSGVSLNELEFPPHSGTSVVSDFNGFLTIDFGLPVLSVSGYFTYSVPIAVVGYDSLLNQLGAVGSQFNINLAVSGAPGSSPNELISLAFATPLSRVTIEGDPAGGSFVLDDLTYVNSSAVPEPSSLLLLGTALAVLALARRRSFCVRVRRKFGVALTILLLTFCAHGLFAQSVAPVSLSPDSITAGVSKNVTISALVLPGAQPVLANGVTLLRIDSAGRSIVIGNLNDSGLSGDAVPGDGIYTTTVSMNESTPGPVKFQVSAAFVSTLRRALSPVGQLEVVSVGAPTTLRSANTANIVDDSSTGGQAVCNEVFVTFRPAATSTDIAAVVASVGVQIVGKLASIGLYQLQIPGCDAASLSAAINALKTNAMVATASSNTVGGLFGVYTPNDPYFLQEWGLIRIKAPSVWGIPQRRGATIGVIDSGVNYNHEDLAGRVALGMDQCGDKQGGNCVGDLDPNDENGHGTGVASIAAAIADNAKGMAGVAFNAPVIAEKITYKQDGSVDAGRAALAIVDAVMKGARVLNLSFGVNDSNGAVQLAINYALERNRVIVAAAGNANSSSQQYPAAYGGVISVGASDESNQRAIWSTNIGGPCPGLVPDQASNYGDWVDIYAPGTNILVAKKSDTSGYETVCGGGTSFATPFVVGAVSLMLSANPNLVPADVKTILKNTAQHTGKFDVQNGREILLLDAAAAVAAALAAPTPGSGTWTSRATFPPPVNIRGVLSFALGTKGYVGVPCFIGVQCNGPFWQYDPDTDHWTQLGNHPSLQFQSPFFVLNGSSYVVSGNQVWQYTPSSDRWTRKQDIPGADKQAGFGFAVNGLGYIGGGFYNGGALWEYNPNTDTWRRRNDHPVLEYGLNDPSVRSIEAVTFTIGSKAYLTGTNSWFWEYSPITDTWIMRSYVDAVYGQAFVLGSKGYVFNTRGALYEYTLGTDQWRSVGTFPGTTICYPAGFAVNDSLYVGVGGRFQSNTCNLDIVNALWRYRP
jgi:thermitase